ncbi:MAG: vitamin K epoxide reductase family protein [Acidobacteria bacterium]|nr:vitamin K epoxide reductase family protein [Acidobacteriota bacterium]
MAEQEVPELETPGLRNLPLAAGVVALVGLADSVYLAVKHFTAEPVPCSLVEGCEKVLTSPYAEVAGVPIAAAGAAAYFIAFALAVLAAYGDGRMWKLFGGLATLMAGFSLWLIYLQAAVIGAFCQFCLISAATSLTLFLIFLTSALISKETSMK